jgi:hypothetical protein
MKKIQDHNVVYLSIWFIHFAKGTPQWPRFHIQCQNIQTATLIIITIHNNFDISEWFQTVCTVYIPESCRWRGIQLPEKCKLICSFLVLLQSTAFWCYCHFLLWNTQQFYDWDGWYWDEVSYLHPVDLGYAPKKMLKLTSPERSLSVNRVKSEPESNVWITV